MSFAANRVTFFTVLYVIEVGNRSKKAGDKILLKFFYVSVLSYNSTCR